MVQCVVRLSGRGELSAHCRPRLRGVLRAPRVRLLFGRLLGGVRLRRFLDERKALLVDVGDRRLLERLHVLAARATVARYPNVPVALWSARMRINADEEPARRYQDAGRRPSPPKCQTCDAWRAETQR